MRTSRGLAGLIVSGALAFAAGCGGGYGAVAPGMTSADVAKEMQMFPTSRVVPFGDGYSATYYANDTCVLFKDDRVVGKDEAQEQRAAVAVPGAGAAGVTVCHALCLPPGMYGQRTCDTQVGAWGPH